MSIMIRALTSESDEEILACIEMLKKASAGTGLMHESFWKNDAHKYTRSWFAWANSLFGELMITIMNEKPYLILKESIM
jgi:meiotically up-regulated gene 157 (Mug157) protein